MSPAPSLFAETLEDLVPVHRLTREQRARLAGSGQVAAIPAGKRLAATQEHDWLDYLLTGKLCLLQGERQEIMEAGSLRACRPVFDPERLRDSAIALSEVALLRLDRQLYETLSGHRPTARGSLDDLALSQTESALLLRFYQACKNGSLALPSLPKVARAIQEAMTNPNINSTRLARIVQMDPAATGGLIQLANSPVYRGAKPIADVRNAIIRLGMELARAVVMGIALKKVFKTKSPLMKQRMKAVWNRSVHVSALSFVIARHGTGPRPEEALLAGLLHAVGEIPLLDFVSQHAGEIDDDELDAAILKLRDIMGELVVRYWGLGSGLVEVVRESGNWYRDRQEPPDACDIVLVARLYRKNQSETPGPLPRYDDVPAYFKLGLGFSATAGKIDVIAEAGEELAAVIGMLKGTG